MQTSNAPTNSAVSNVAAAPRLFDRLDAASKDRVTLLLSRLQALLPVEQDAFVQELEQLRAASAEAVAAEHKARGKLVRYHGPSLEAVQSRDRGYVVPRVLPATERSAASGGPAAAPPPCTLEELVRTPGMFGEAEVAIHLDKMSLYDKLHQNMASRRASKAPTTVERQSPSPSVSGDIGGGASSPPLESRGAESTAVTMQTDGAARGTVAALPPSRAPYRTNAYQAVRLAMSSPGFIAAQKPTSRAAMQTGHDGVQSALNLTGIAITEDDLREWFDELDEEGRGALSLEGFQSYMQSLERDFGVSDEYAALQRAGEQLAFDGRLSFEAFAYLVLRFARM